MRVILASKSEIRRKLIEAAGFVLECVESDADESKILDLDPGKRALGRARLKTDQVVSNLMAKFKNESFIVIGADQVLWMDGEFFTKAKSQIEAVQTLTKLQSKQHSLFTACCIAAVTQKGVETYEHLVRTDMKMRKLSDLQIKNYVDTGEGKKSVGCYEFENLGILLFEDVKGDALAIPGLPTMWVIENLLQLGVKPTWMH